MRCRNRCWNMCRKSGKKVNQLFDRAMQDERLYAMAFCGPGGKLLYKTGHLSQVARLPRWKERHR